MKFIFDRAVKGENEGYRFSHKQTLSGNGPWNIHGMQFNVAEEWFEYAKSAGRALGISGCECGILPSEENEKNFVFSFENERDYMSFSIAVFGDDKGEYRRTVKSNSEQDRNDCFQALIHFMQTNEIGGDVLALNETDFMVVTFSRFDDFAIADALLKGKFKPDVSPVLQRPPENN